MKIPYHKLPGVRKRRQWQNKVLSAEKFRVSLRPSYEATEKEKWKLILNPQLTSAVFDCDRYFRRLQYQKFFPVLPVMRGMETAVGRSLKFCFRRYLRSNRTKKALGCVNSLFFGRGQGFCVMIQPFRFAFIIIVAVPVVFHCRYRPRSLSHFYEYITTAPGVKNPQRMEETGT